MSANGATCAGGSPSAHQLFAELMRDASVRAEIHATGWSRTAFETATAAGCFDALVAAGSGRMGAEPGVPVELVMAVGHHLVPAPFGEHAVALALGTDAATGVAGERLAELTAGRQTFALVDADGAPGVAAAAPRVVAGRLSGAVAPVRFAATAVALLVIAEQDGAPVVALVGTADPGVTITERQSFDPAMRDAHVRLEQVPTVVVSRTGGAVGDAARVVEGLRARMRLMVACEIAGAARRMVDHAVRFARAEVRWGRAIGSQRDVQQLLADLSVDVMTLEATCRDAGRSVATRPGEAHARSVEAKAMAARVGRRVGEGAMRLHGPVAFRQDHDLHRWFAHVLALQGYYGEEVRLARETGRRLLSAHAAASGSPNMGHPDAQRPI